MFCLDQKHRNAELCYCTNRGWLRRVLLGAKRDTALSLLAEYPRAGISLFRQLSCIVHGFKLYVPVTPEGGGGGVEGWLRGGCERGFQMTVP